MKRLTSGIAREVVDTSKTVRGALLAYGPDSSLDEVHRGSCSGNIHMEEEEDGRDK